MGGNSAQLKFQRAKQCEFAYARAIVVSLVLLQQAPAFALNLERAALHQFEDGPILPASHIFLPGETVFLSARFKSYQISVSADEQRSVKMSWSVNVTDPAGIAVVPAKSGKIADTLSAQDKDWLPKLNVEFTVPPYAASGNYQISIVGIDEVANSEVTSLVMVLVRGHAVDPSETLVVRNLHFLRSEQDRPPLEPVAFHPGDTLWARFDITGYKFEKNNGYSVEYGLAVLRESGEQVFAQPAAASDAHESFYPQRYVPGALSLNLATNVPLGTYTLLVTVEDKIGREKVETRGTFRVER